MTVRTRFAPSPTGYFHVGGARTALFSWLYAKQHGGEFVLRIEDTDRERSTEESVQIILEGMDWLGLDVDIGPLFQSEGLERHRSAAERLLDSGAAYRCHATTEEIARAREQAKAAGNPSWKYTGPGCVISLEQQAERAASGAPSVVRFAVPREAGPIEFEDLVYGPQRVDPNEIDDFVLLRADGSPLYMLSVVCDDIEVAISHVIRGQDHLSNTPKQILLYRALGAEVPQFAHLPLILAPGGEKLSKRKHGDVVSVTTYRDRGFPPEALINFLALLGWAPGEGETQEIFTRDELLARFDLTRVNRSNAKFIFDPHDPRQWTDAKALNLSAQWIRTMPLEQLIPQVQPWLERAGAWDESYLAEQRAWFASTLDLIRERFWTLEDFARQGAAYLGEQFEFDERAVAKNLRHEVLAELLPELAGRLESLPAFDHESVEEAVRWLAEQQGVKPGLLINALRTAVTGQSVGPGAFELAVAIGRERVCRRLREAVGLVAATT